MRTFPTSCMYVCVYVLSTEFNYSDSNVHGSEVIYRSICNLSVAVSHWRKWNNTPPQMLLIVNNSQGIGGAPWVLSLPMMKYREVQSHAGHIQSQLQWVHKYSGPVLFRCLFETKTPTPWLFQSLPLLPCKVTWGLGKVMQMTSLQLATQGAFLLAI